MLVNLIKKWFSQIGIHDLSDESVLGVIRQFKLDKLGPQYIMLLKMASPIIFMVIAKLKEETIDWGNLDNMPGVDPYGEEVNA